MPGQSPGTYQYVCRKTYQQIYIIVSTEVLRFLGTTLGTIFVPIIVLRNVQGGLFREISPHPREVNICVRVGIRCAYVRLNESRSNREYFSCAVSLGVSFFESTLTNRRSCHFLQHHLQLSPPLQVHFLKIYGPLPTPNILYT